MLCAFRAGRSCLLAALCSVVQVAAVTALISSALPLAAKLLMVAILTVHGIALLRRVLLTEGSAPVAVHVDNNDTLLELVNGRRIPVLPSTVYCIAALQIVHFRRQGSAAGPGFWLTVLPDSADLHKRRLLRTWLLTVPVQATQRPAQASG